MFSKGVSCFSVHLSAFLDLCLISFHLEVIDEDVSFMIGFEITIREKNRSAKEGAQKSIGRITDE